MKISAFIVLLFTFLYSKDPVAIVSKVRGDARLKDKNSQKYLNKLDVNSPIYFDSQIITKKKTFVKLIFLDDGSSISIYPQTEIVINGSLDKRKILKNVEILHGVTKINIVNQLDNEFQIISPNSKLNCNECGFWLLSNQLNGDKYIKINGNLKVFNQSMESSISLGLDSTLLSIIDEDFNKYKSTINEIKYLESFMLEFDEQNIKNKELNSNDMKTTKSINTLVIKLKNAANTEKEIILTYTN
jgi:hypothetical protein